MLRAHEAVGQFASDFKNRGIIPRIWSRRTEYFPGSGARDRINCCNQVL
jgi:hypothetical protein